VSYETGTASDKQATDRGIAGPEASKINPPPLLTRTARRRNPDATAITSRLVTPRSEPMPNNRTPSGNLAGKLRLIVSDRRPHLGYNAIVNEGVKAA